MVAWNQLDGNNVVIKDWVYPGYSEKMGCSNGAQDDIFEEADTVAPSSGSADISTIASVTLPLSSSMSMTKDVVMSTSSGSSPTEPLPISLRK
jgi:hypothetical protein